MHGFVQVFFLEHVADADFVHARTGRGIEAGGRSQHDGLAIDAEVFEQPLAELVGVVDRQAGHSVERALGIGAEAAFHLVNRFHHDIAALGVFGQNGIEVFGRSVDSGFAENLPVGGRAQTGLGGFHRSGVHFLVLGHEHPDTATASGVTLGDGIQQDHVVFQAFEVHYRMILAVIVAEFAVHFIGHQEEVVLLDNLSQHVEFFFGIEIAGGVVRIANQDRLGLGRDFLVELFNRGKGEAVLDFGDDGYRGHPGQSGKAGIVGVERFGHDYFIAGVQTGHESEKNRFGTAVGHDDFVFVDIDAVGLVVLAQFLAE